MKSGWFISDWDVVHPSAGGCPEYHNRVTKAVQSDDPHPTCPYECNPARMDASPLRHGLGRVTQSMHDAADGAFKGMIVILTERGVHVGHIRACCTKAQQEAGHPEGSGCKPGARCCCTNILNCQPDFTEQRSARSQTAPIRRSDTGLK